MKTTVNNILELKTPEIWDRLTDELGNYYNDIMLKKNAYLFMSNYNSPIMLQAHVDTRRAEAIAIKLHENDNIVCAESILGADDRAGVYAIIKIVNDCKDKGLVLPTILFTDEEETGSKGMREFLKKVKRKKFRKIKLALALDRQGVGQYVVYNRIERDVHKYIMKFGFVEQTGSFSDISLFQKEFNIPAVNLSVGYYNQHTINERLHKDELNLTIERVKKIIANPIAERYETKPIKVEKTKGKWEDDDNEFAAYGYGWGTTYSQGRLYDPKVAAQTTLPTVETPKTDKDKDAKKSPLPKEKSWKEYAGVCWEDICECCDEKKQVKWNQEYQCQICYNCSKQLLKLERGY